MKNKYRIEGDTAVVIYKAFEFYIDLEDLPILQSYDGNWFVNVTGGNPYVVTKTPFIMRVLLHRLLTNAPDGMVVDHINGNTLDNRRSNLRVTTYSKNTLNRHRLGRNNTSGVTGVHYHKRDDVWTAVITINGERRELGRFKNKEDAIKARKDAEKAYL